MRCKVFVLVSLMSLVAMAQPPADRHRSLGRHYHNWERLKSWAGEYPISERGSIFNDLEFHQVLLGLVGEADLKSIIENFTQAEVIDIVHGYLVLQSAKTDSTPPAVLVFRLRDGKAYTALYTFFGIVLYARTSVPVGDPPLLTCLPDPEEEQPPAPHLQNLQRLKTWANEYPISKKGSIFNDQDVHHALLDLLGDANYKRLIEDFALADPIDIIRGHIFLQGMTGHSNPRRETAMVALRLNDGKAHIAFHSHKKSILFPIAEEPVDLPRCISESMKTGDRW